MRMLYGEPKTFNAFLVAVGRSDLRCSRSSAPLGTRMHELRSKGATDADVASLVDLWNSWRELPPADDDEIEQEA